jgi:hypothetical protein
LEAKKKTKVASADASDVSSQKPVDQQAMQSVMAELQEIGVTDPAGREKLMEDLRGSDPAIWSLVIQQYRSTQAYRQQVTQRHGGACGEPERLPPPHESQVAVASPIQTTQPIADATPLAQAASTVVQASYPAPEPLTKNGDAATLLVRNLSFCTEILAFGKNKPLPKNELHANQETLLYAEVENFASEPTPRGYHTSLTSGYRIVDADGRCVDEHTYAPTEDDCLNRRHDFFIGYRIRMPQSLSPGFYRLLLTVEDQLTRKVGQSEVGLEITK